MKKGLWLCSIMALMLVIVMGCSSKEETKEEGSAKESEDIKSDLLDFYLSIANVINGSDGDLNAYEGAENPSALTQEDKQKAAASANSVADALEGIEVPDSLDKYSKDLEKAIKTISDSYREKGIQLSGTAEPKLDQANEHFNAGSEKINNIFKAEDLIPPNLAAEVNG